MGVPYTFMGIPPERHHFVDFQSSCCIGATSSCSQSSILHLGQEVLGERTADIVVIAIL